MPGFGSHPGKFSLAVLCFLLAAAIVLLRYHVAPAASWTQLRRGPSPPSTCPPARQLGPGKNSTSTKTYQQCLARHGRDLDSGYSSRYAHHVAALSHLHKCSTYVWPPTV